MSAARDAPLHLAAAAAASCRYRCHRHRLRHCPRHSATAAAAVSSHQAHPRRPQPMLLARALPGEATPRADGRAYVRCACPARALPAPAHLAPRCPCTSSPRPRPEPRARRYPVALPPRPAADATPAAPLKRQPRPPSATHRRLASADAPAMLLAEGVPSTPCAAPAALAIGESAAHRVHVRGGHLYTFSGPPPPSPSPPPPLPRVRAELAVRAPRHAQHPTPAAAPPRSCGQPSVPSLTAAHEGA